MLRWVWVLILHFQFSSLSTHTLLSFINGPTVQHRLCTTQGIFHISLAWCSSPAQVVCSHGYVFSELHLAQSHSKIHMHNNPSWTHSTPHTPSLPHNGTLWIDTKFSAHHYLSFQKFTYLLRKNQVSQIERSVWSFSPSCTTWKVKVYNIHSSFLICVIQFMNHLSYTDLNVAALLQFMVMMKTCLIGMQAKINVFFHHSITFICFFLIMSPACSLHVYNWFCCLKPSNIL